MVDRLSSVMTTVDDYSISIGQFQIPGQVANRAIQMADQLLILVRDVVDRGDFFPGNHQQVNGRLSIDVFDCNAQIVLVDDVRRQLAVDDSLEYRFFTHFQSPVLSALLARVQLLQVDALGSDQTRNALMDWIKD